MGKLRSRALEGAREAVTVSRGEKSADDSTSVGGSPLRVCHRSQSASMLGSTPTAAMSGDHVWIWMGTAMNLQLSHRLMQVALLA